MGGGGALTIALQNPGKFKSVSAFAPISHLTASKKWGKDAIEAYLGSVDGAKKYDATELISTYEGPKVPIMVDVGSADSNLDELLVDDFLEAADKKGIKVHIRKLPNYDHGYYFVSSFI
jgi:S-formylglutathione hydrolase